MKLKHLIQNQKHKMQDKQLFIDNNITFKEKDEKNKGKKKR